MVIVNQIQIHILVKKLLNCQLCWLILASIAIVTTRPFSLPFQYIIWPSSYDWRLLVSLMHEPLLMTQDTTQVNITIET